jgi:hypothetical protein
VTGDTVIKIMKLTAKQKQRFAEKIIEWGNIVFAGTILAQGFSKEYNPIIALIGALTWLASLIVGTYIK